MKMLKRVGESQLISRACQMSFTPLESQGSSLIDIKWINLMLPYKKRYFSGSELKCVFCLLQVIELPLNQVFLVACVTIAKVANTTCVLMLSSVPPLLTMGICVATTNMQQIFVSSNFVILLFRTAFFWYMDSMDNEVDVWNVHREYICSLSKFWPALVSLFFLSI